MDEKSSKYPKIQNDGALSFDGFVCVIFSVQLNISTNLVSLSARKLISINL
jgi:hypothetical protein